MFLIKEKCWILFLGGISWARAFNIYVVPDQELDHLVETEFPTEEIPTSTEDLSEFDDITMENDNYDYTTIVYQYEIEQFMGMNDPKERCFDDYTKCLTSMISAHRPVCAFQGQSDVPRSIRTFRTTCDVHLDNCYMGHRHWRLLDYGKCIKSENPPYDHWKQPWYYKIFDVVNTK